jgi:hypothetical protein
LKEGGASESGPDEAALEAGVGLRIVNDTFDVADMARNKECYVIIAI